METPQTTPVRTEPSLELRIKALHEKLETVFREVLRDALEQETLEHIDWCLLEWRWVESQIARQAVALDLRIQGVISQVARKPAGRGSTLQKMRLFRWRRSDNAVPTWGIDDAEAASILQQAVVQSHLLLVMLRGYREFLEVRLTDLEAELARQLALLHKIPVGARETDDAMRRIEMLQDVVDGLIGMIASSNLLFNKLMVDAEAGILAIASLAKVPQRASSQLELLETLFHRAERGLLSAGGIAHRKAVLDEMFQSKLSTTRQVTG